MSASFSGLDVGLLGGSLYPGFARSTVKVLHGEPVVSRTSFAFAGVDGKFSHYLGFRGRQITWKIQHRVISLATLTAIEIAIENRMRTGEGQLISTTGRVFSRSILLRHQAAEGFDQILSGELAGWITREDTLVFEVMA